MNVNKNEQFICTTESTSVSEEENSQDTSSSDENMGEDEKVNDDDEADGLMSLLRDSTLVCACTVDFLFFCSRIRCM